jgi:hypothetical protein
MGAPVAATDLAVVGLAANVTKRLWEIGDIVDVLEAREKP